MLAGRAGRKEIFLYLVLSVGGMCWALFCFFSGFGQECIGYYY